jgi:peptidoglycan/LPS O-acetylase OafA/YrhL
MAFGFVIVKGRFEGVTTLTSYMIQGFFYSGMALSVTLSLVGIFGIFFKKSSSVLSNISKHSFIVYLLHLPILISVGRWIIGISKSMYVCWFILLATVLVLSVMSSQIIGFAQKLLHRFKQTQSLKPAKIFDNKEIHSLSKQD